MFNRLYLIRNLTTCTPNADGLKACENAYILVGFIFRLVENSPRKCSQQTVQYYATEIQKYITFSKSRLAAHVNTSI
jgi:phosphoribosylanthranilate isomerase